MESRKICLITGTRAEYGLLKPVMKEITQSRKLALQVLAMGMHLLPEFGRTVREIKKDGFKVDALVKTTSNKESKTAMTQSIGKGIIGIADSLAQLKPEIVLVLGDRTEALSGAIAAVYMNIVLAHIHGGDNARAGLDEYARHAITKLAHIHFPATKKSAERIIKMGEDSWRVHMVGAPGLDSILKEKLIPPSQLADKYKLDLGKPVLLVVQHPVTTEIEEAEQQIKETMETIKELAFQSIVIYPNADAGGRRMIKILEKYRKFPFVRLYKNLSHLDYLSLMRIVKVMIGNSSSGIIEAPSFHLPVVNIGTREQGRERANNVIDADYDKKEIKTAVQKALFDKKFRKKLKESKNPYGRGKAAKRIVKILSSLEINKKLLQKKLTY